MAKKKGFHNISIRPKAGTHYEVNHEPVHEGKEMLPMGSDGENEKLFSHGERAGLHQHIDDLMDAHEGKAAPQNDELPPDLHKLKTEVNVTPDRLQRRIEMALAKLHLEPNDVVLADSRRVTARDFQKLDCALGCHVVIFVRCEPGETPEHALARIPREEAAQILKQICFPNDAQGRAEWERTCGKEG